MPVVSRPVVMNDETGRWGLGRAAKGCEEAEVQRYTVGLGSRSRSYYVHTIHF